LANIADTDVIEAFLSETTCESLVHKLGRKGPQTTKEILTLQLAIPWVRRWLGKFSTILGARQSGMRMLAKAPLTVQIRRTSSDMGTHSWPLLKERVAEHPLRALLTTSRSFSRGYA
jgi:hypothetical protein